MATLLKHTVPADDDHRSPADRRAAAAPPVTAQLDAVVTQLLPYAWRSTAAGALARYAAHLTVIAVIVAALLIGRVAQPGSRRTVNPKLPAGAAPASDPAPVETFFERGFFLDSNVVSPLADAHTLVPTRLRREIQVYVVQPGDTVQGIAAFFGLQPETIMWSNPAVEDTPDLLRIGQEIVILPIDGVYHEVAEGDTLSGIAQKYKVDVPAITDVEWNNLAPPDYAITPGMKLIAAGGSKPLITKVVVSYSGPIPTGAVGTGQFRWPVLGRISQDYWSGHRAIDIATPPNTPVYAADSGYVSFVGWTDVGYGYLVRIDHGNGFETWYAHNNSFAVTLGEQVERGQVIAYSGNTGRSTGPHVHFEIRYLGALQNPRVYLP